MASGWGVVLALPHKLLGTGHLQLFSLVHAWNCISRLLFHEQFSRHSGLRPRLKQCGAVPRASRNAGKGREELVCVWGWTIGGCAREEMPWYLRSD